MRAKTHLYTFKKEIALSKCKHGFLLNMYPTSLSHSKIKTSGNRLLVVWSLLEVYEQLLALGSVRVLLLVYVDQKVSQVVIK